MLQILCEELAPEVCNLITEASVDGKTAWLSGVFMQSEIKNRNGRKYPLNEISGAVELATRRIKETNGVLGELGHPQTLEINLDRTSHVITEMRMDGPNAVGKAKIMSTPMGNIAKELLRNEVLLGVSSRGAGNVNESGGVSDFQWVTVDIVCQPSAPGAFPNTVYESLIESVHGTKVLSLAELLQRDISAQKYFKKEITKWLHEGLFKRK
ncbi:MAG: hypothetical protein ACREAU_00330 [Nitrosopumilaceae archaeon]